MKRIMLVSITLAALSVMSFAQTLYVNKHDGTFEPIPIASIDSLTFTPPIMAVAGGTFSAAGTPVTISSFNVYPYVVTYELWTAIQTWGEAHGYSLTAGQNGSDAAEAALVGLNNYPVTKVNWFDIITWCNARSEKEGLEPVYYTDGTQTEVYRTGEINIGADAVKWTANGYRLPTEYEWEFAARGGNLTHNYLYSGSDVADDVAWISTNADGTTHTIGTKAPNELCLYDMCGNVWHYCWDWAGSSYPEGGTTDPTGAATGTNKILRGGSFHGPESYSAITNRSMCDPTVRAFNAGFRCVQH